MPKARVPLVAVLPTYTTPVIGPAQGRAFFFITPGGRFGYVQNLSQGFRCEVLGMDAFISSGRPGFLVCRIPLGPKSAVVPRV